jgi:hypothetical protein
MPELTEPVETINQRLMDHFGVADDGRPIYRIVWSEDQFEKRFGVYEDYSGDIYLRTVKEVREVPKYRQWIHEKYVLENLVIVPPINSEELMTKISYEPLWVFMDKAGFPLPPKWEAAKFIIDQQQAIRGQESLGPKYRDKYMTEDAKSVREDEVQNLRESLFGNESSVGDALADKQSTIVMPKSIKGA